MQSLMHMYFFCLLVHRPCEVLHYSDTNCEYIWVTICFHSYHMLQAYLPIWTCHYKCQELSLWSSKEYLQSASQTLDEYGLQTPLE